jgi:ABC-2 type transport system permease protein
MNDLWTVFWKEWKELLLSSGGRRRGLLRVFVAVIILAVLWPLQMGPSYVVSGVGPMFAGYFAAIFVMGMIPDSFAGERERHTLETLLSTSLTDSAIMLGKVAAAVSYGWGVGIVSLILGLGVVNIAHGHGHLLMYPRAIAFGALVIGLLVAMMVAFVGVLVSLHAQTVKQAQQVLSTGLMILVFVPLFGARLVPESWRGWFHGTVETHGPSAIVASIALGIALFDVILYIACRARFQREKLMLD